MQQQTILIIEDEEDIAELLRISLEKHGHRTAHVANGEDGLRMARSLRPDLVLLDLMLPGMNGLEVCKGIKSGESTAAIPVIMVTARGEEHEIVAGLEMGADDYIVKPFSVKVLVARVNRVLSKGRAPQQTSETGVLDVKGLQIDEKRREVRYQGSKLELTTSEFTLLYFLASHPGWVYTRSQIVKAVHGENYPVTDRSVDVLVLGLRRKLGEPGRHVETVRGVGYRFSE